MNPHEEGFVNSFVKKDKRHAHQQSQETKGVHKGCLTLRSTHRRRMGTIAKSKRCSRNLLGDF
jgi:hypothetical protein